VTGTRKWAPPRIAFGVALVLCVVAGTAFAAFHPDAAAEFADRLLGATRNLGMLGIALFGLAQILVAVSGVLPAALLGAAAGAIYGVGPGFALAAVSTLLGALLAFVAARTLLRGFAERALIGRPRLRDLDDRIAGEGWRLICLLRMSPVMPFSATSYALGLSSVSTRDYLIGTLAAMPALFGYVLLGSLTRSGVAQWSVGGGPIRLALLGLGVVATAFLTLRLGQLARKAGLFQTRPRIGRGVLDAR
jgi:uncharacterized membrane protein YdjX (TVP38/TMEM64 family)